MATSALKTVLVKQLKEYLQEQQEPFKLNTYLSERQYLRKSSSSDEGNSCCLTTSTENLKESCSHGSNKKRILHTLQTLKWMLHKLITPNDKQQQQQRLLTCNKAVKDKLISETIDLIQQIAETNWFSTVSNVTALSTSLDCEAPEANPHCEPHNRSLCTETSQALNVRRFEGKKGKKRYI